MSYQDEYCNVLLYMAAGISVLLTCRATKMKQQRPLSSYQLQLQKWPHNYYCTKRCKSYIQYGVYKFCLTEVEETNEIIPLPVVTKYTRKYTITLQYL